MAPTKFEVKTASKKADKDMCVATAFAATDASTNASLWAQAMAVTSVKTLVLITLDVNSSNFSKRRRLFKITLCKYAPDHHIIASPS